MRVLVNLHRQHGRSAIAVIALIAIFISALIGFLISKWGVTGGVMLLISTIAPLAIFFIIKNPKFGVLIYLIAAYLVMFVISIGVNFPLGTVMDGILLLLLIGFLIDQKINPDWTILKYPISIVIIVWILYNMIQIINPNAESKLAWLYTIRSVAAVMLSYFIFSYQIKSIAFIRTIIKIWLFLSFIGALYAIKQEYFGFSDFEQRNIDSSPLFTTLLFIDGHWRKWSIFSDPVAFSYNMIVSSILCISLMFAPFKLSTKILLGMLTVLFLYVMLFSGTRAAYVLLPAAMALLCIMKLNIKVFFIGSIATVFFLILIFIPTSNYTLFRFQSAFRPSDDASYSVRANNQKRIQPYIKSHPIGGGLGSTGTWGAKFSPNSYLAQFPPDSGYMRVAVELGWVGLLLICALFMMGMINGINNYFRIKNKELKAYCLGMTLIVFALTIGNFPQEAIVQFPLNVYFYLFLAIINVVYRLDTQEQFHAKNLES